jgi:hypothetical protein
MSSFKQSLNKFVTESLRMDDAKINPVRIMSQAVEMGFKPKRCYNNAKTMLNGLKAAEKEGLGHIAGEVAGVEFKSTIVPCWIIHSHKEIICDLTARFGVYPPKAPIPTFNDFEAEFHFVLQGPSGKITDITPDQNGKKMFRRIVLETRITFEEFEMIGKIPQSIDSPTWVARCPGEEDEDTINFFDLVHTIKMFRGIRKIVV